MLWKRKNTVKSGWLALKIGGGRRIKTQSDSITTNISGFHPGNFISLGASRVLIADFDLYYFQAVST